jgi:hypothetical protein
MAAVSEMPLQPQQPQPDKLAPPPVLSAKAGASGPKQTAVSAERTINLKVEVQRAGAVPALTAMLKGADEGCIQAAANALYVLASDSENRSVMQSSDAVEALQAVIAQSKQRPPAISARTTKDCNEALIRIM